MALKWTEMALNWPEMRVKWPLVGGEWSSSCDVDFYIEGDMVHIAEHKVHKAYGDYFIKHINKFEEIITDLHKSRTMLKAN